MILSILTKFFLWKCAGRNCVLMLHSGPTITTFMSWMQLWCNFKVAFVRGWFESQPFFVSAPSRMWMTSYLTMISSWLNFTWLKAWQHFQGLLLMRKHSIYGLRDISRRGHSITMWTRFWSFLTPFPLKWTILPHKAYEVMWKFDTPPLPLFLSTWLLNDPLQ